MCCNDIRKLGLRSDQMESINPFTKVIKRLPKQEFLRISNILQYVTIGGKVELAIRRIDKNGQSAMLTTSEKWHHLESLKGFYCDMSIHKSYELIKCKKLGQNILTRSSNKTNTAFLKALNKNGFDNTVLFHKINNQYIYTIYLIGNNSDPYLKDVILNQLSKIKNLFEMVQPTLDFIFSSKEIIKIKKQLLLPSVKEQLFTSNSDHHSLLLKSDKGDITLSKDEIRYLYCIGFNYTCGEIIEHCKLLGSVKTRAAVKGGIERIKNKIGLYKKEELNKFVCNSFDEIKSLYLKIN